MNEINRRIDEIADVAKWIISAHGTTDLKIQDALELTIDDLKSYGAEYTKYFINGINMIGYRLIPCEVESVWFGNMHQYIRVGQEFKIKRDACVSDLIHGPIEILPACADGRYWDVNGVTFSTDFKEVVVTAKMSKE